MKSRGKAILKLKSIKIKNFRAYKDETEIILNDLTTFIGKNDSGKSSILEALDIFFNEGKGAVKFDGDDINVDNSKNGDNETVISACFTELPSTIILDATHETSLKQEYLLNDNDELEIVKRITPSSTGGKIKTFIKAYHPCNPKCANLLSKTNADLKKTVEKLGIQEIANLSCNSEMREAIWNTYKDDLQLDTVELDTSKGEAKAIWPDLNKYLPVFSLFQADRKNTDNDSEVQDPLKEAVKEIMQQEELINTLNKVAEEVRNKLQEVSDKTLEKLREMSPEIADSLKPVIPPTASLKWAEIFKNVSIAGDDNIPINKRGSGVKRLILLNFFRATAERRLAESHATSIIYAFEEPETSQHNENQKKLVKAFTELSIAPNTQIIMTTHSPIVVKALNINDIRLIVNNHNCTTVEMISEVELPYPSLNEINYIAFNETNIEYHDELYSYIESHKQLDNFRSGQSTRKYIKVDKKNKITNWNIILSEYIRHQIHHPENTNNIKYTEEELKESIQLMRNFIRRNKAAFADEI